MPPEELENQPLGNEAQVSEPVGTDESGGANGAATLGRQSYSRVTAEEAETLPFAELKRRMREEADLTEKGLLFEDDDGPLAGTTDGANVEPSSGTNPGRNAGSTPAPQADGTPQSRPAVGGTDADALAQARREAAEARAEVERIRKERETADFQARHQQVEARIASLPTAAQQEIARQHYYNQLNQQALGEFTQHLTAREAAIRQAELVQTRAKLPSLLSEMADGVAERHGVKADTLKSYVNSPQFKELLNAAQNEDALTGAAINAGQWMEYLAGEEATRLATQREQRRLNAAANKQMRDTPQGNVSGGGIDEVTRIRTMPREEFFKMKHEQLRQARAAA